MLKLLYIGIQLSACLGLISSPALASSSGKHFPNIPAYDIFSATEPSQDEENKFILFINQGTLTIKYGKPVELIKGEVIVYNLLGQEITRKKLENSNINQVTIPVQNSCYLIRINYSGKVHTQKVMITSI